MQRILKHALVAAALCGISTLASAQSADPLYNGLSNGVIPPNMPTTINVQRVPYGSGTPQPGITSGYDAAVYTGGGLYYVPGFLAYESDGRSMQARVIQVSCHLQDKAWYCGGYAIPPDLGPNEYLVVQPLFQH